ncbi:hypothetical protein SERLA73DRAFT_142965, partial [Serpula lacrymans var. lacrymans S7.3]
MGLWVWVLLLVVYHLFALAAPYAGVSQALSSQPAIQEYPGYRGVALPSPCLSPWQVVVHL